MKLLKCNLKVFTTHFTLVLCFLLVDNTLQGQNRMQQISSWYDFDAVAQSLDLKPGHWMADIGTRDGFYLNHFLPFLSETGHIFAVDISSEDFDRLHASMDRWGYNNISTIYSKETNPLLPAGSLDSIFIRNAYHEFSKPLEMLKHLREALKTGGRLVISEPMRENLRNQDRKTQEKNHALDIEFALKDLEEAGFTVIKKDLNFAQTPSRRTNTSYWLLIAIPTVN